MGDCLFRLQRFRESLFAYGEAMRLGNAGAGTQHGMLCAIQKTDPKDFDAVKFALASFEAAHKKRSNCPETTYRLGSAKLHTEQYEQVVELATELLSHDFNRPECFALRGLAYQQLGQYDRALLDLDRAFVLDAEFIRQKRLNLNRAFLRGQLGDTDEGRAALRHHFLSATTGDGDEQLEADMVRRVRGEMGDSIRSESVGVFLGVFHSALGHAVLDPFHFYNLFAHRFDRLVMITPPSRTIGRTMELPLKILDQYVDRIETTNMDLLDLAWQNIGSLTHDNLTFLVHNYWGLNRMAFKARREPGHPMRNRRQYFRLPRKISNEAERICNRNGIDLERPLVVLHAREQAYHNLRGQSFRNTDILNYVPAIRRLIDDGYQVIRIGDKKMTSVRSLAEGIIELPSLASYDPMLDPFLISRCRFMISCQSGPCSYARIFGKPNLVVNAVFHYTLIPEANELVAFKNYVDMRTREPLDVEKIMRAGCHLYDRTEHFTDHGIEVEDMTPQEILAAVDEMIAWQNDAMQPESAAQEQFRECMQWHMLNPDLTNPLHSPMSDYIGYALPECRLSDAVTRMRPGYLQSRPTPANARNEGYRIAI